MMAVEGVIQISREKRERFRILGNETKYSTKAGMRGKEKVVRSYYNSYTLDDRGALEVVNVRKRVGQPNTRGSSKPTYPSVI